MISLGGNIGIGLTLRLNNQFSAQAARIAGDMQRLHGNAQQALRQNLSAARNIGLGMAVVGGMATNALFKATKEAAHFDYQLVGVKAVTGETSEAVAGLRKQILDLNIASIYGASDIAGAAYELTKAGFSLSDAKQALGGVTQFGAAGDMGITGKHGAGAILAHTLNTFGLASNQAERVADTMSFAANKSSVDLADMAESINYVGSEATTLKLPIETISAMLGVMGNAGIKGSSAGVALANMLRYLGQAVTQFRTKKQGKMLEALGIDPNSLLQANGELKESTEIVDTFMKALTSKSSPEQVAALTGLFNIRGSKAMTKLMTDPKIGMNFRDFMDEILTKAPGTAKAIADMKLDSPFGRLEVLQSTAENARIVLGETLIPLMDILLKVGIKLLDMFTDFMKTPFGKAFVWIAAGLAIATTAAGAFIVILSSIKLLTLASSVSFRNMGRSLIWAWNSAAAAATRYALVSKAAATPTWVMGPGGKFAGGKMVGKGVAGAAGGGMFQTIKTFIGHIAKGVGPLGRVVNMFRAIGGLSLGIITLVTMMVGFGNIIKGVIYALGTFLHTLFWIWDFVTNIMKGPGEAMRIAGENFGRRNNHFRESLGFEPMPVSELVQRGNVDKYENTKGLKELMERQRSNKPTIQTNQPIPPGTVVLDGKKVGDVMFQQSMRFLEGGAEPN